jgi:hypothetical protein
MENIKTDNVNGIVIGAKIYNSNNVLFNWIRTYFGQHLAFCGYFI